MHKLKSLFILATVFISLSCKNNVTRQNLRGRETTPVPDKETVRLLTISGELEFGSVNVGAEKINLLTVENTATLTATNLKIASLSLPFVQSETLPEGQHACSEDLAAGATCTVGVSFRPTEVGSYEENIILEAEADGIAISGLATLSGASQSHANLTLAASNLGTLSIGDSLQKELTFTNSGNLPVWTWNNASCTGICDFAGGAFPGTSGTCSGELAPLATCTVTLVCTSSGTEENEAALSISYSDSEGAQTTQFALSATVSNAPRISDFTLRDGQQLETEFTNETTVEARITSPDASTFCVSRTNTAPSADDSCWIESTTQYVTVDASSATTLYAFARNAPLSRINACQCLHNPRRLSGVHRNNRNLHSRTKIPACHLG